MTPSPIRLTDRQRGPLLWALLAAFALRVAGQIVVVVAHPSWLPPMEHWYSGLLPYPLLLPAQLTLIVALAMLARHVTRHGGRLPGGARRRVWLAGASYVYAAAMVVRYVAQMMRHPEWRWLGHTIPIAFHLVLAGYLFVLAGSWRPSSAARGPARTGPLPDTGFPVV